MPPPQGRKSSHLTGHCWAPAAAATQDLWCLARGLHQVAYLNEVFASHSTNTNKVPLKIHFISDHLSFEKSEKKGTFHTEPIVYPSFLEPILRAHWSPTTGDSPRCSRTSQAAAARNTAGGNLLDLTAGLTVKVQVVADWRWDMSSKWPKKNRIWWI